MRSLILAALALAAPATAGSFVSVQQATSISQQVNAGMKFVPEAGLHDDWQIGRETGDCEDFALTKREALIAAGMDPARIRILVLRNAKGGHAVLSVRFNSMHYVFERYDTAAPMPLRPFLKANGFKIFCEARDLTPGDKPASSRC